MKNKIKKILKNDILKRAIKTFIQGFLSSLVVFINTSQNFDEKVIKSALIGAIAGGISALMNFIINLLKKGDE
jgi:hypothetical protein